MEKRNGGSRTHRNTERRERGPGLIDVVERKAAACLLCFIVLKELKEGRGRAGWGKDGFGFGAHVLRRRHLLDYPVLEARAGIRSMKKIL